MKTRPPTHAARKPLRDVLRHPMAWMFGPVASTCSDVRDLQLAEELALRELAEGVAQHRAWRDVTAMCLVAHELAEAGIGPEAREPCTWAFAVLLNCQDGPWPLRLYETELGALRVVLDLHIQQRAAVTKARFDAARLRVVEQLRQMQGSDGRTGAAELLLKKASRIAVEIQGG